MCHTRNHSSLFHYCIDGLYLITFPGFTFSTNIAELERFWPQGQS